MAQVINTNIASLNAQRNLNTSQGSLATSLQRLSSGLRINSAKDDAAGLAISERFTAQIRGSNQAARNANDGISLAQTAEGALSSAGDILQRIRELAVQSANASNAPGDRQALQNEVTQLVQELDRIAVTTNFNGKALFDGTFGSVQFQVGANAFQTITANTSNLRTSNYGNNQANATGTNVGPGPVSTTTPVSAVTNGTVTINGYLGSDSIQISAGQSAKTIAENITSKSEQTGVSASARTDVLLDFDAAGAYALTIAADDGTTETVAFTLSQSTGADALSAAVTAFNDRASKTGITASLNADNRLVLSSATGANITIGDTAAANAGDVTVRAVAADQSTPIGAPAVTLSSTVANESTVVTGQIMLDSERSFSVTEQDSELFGASLPSTLNKVSDMDVTSFIKASETIKTVDAALSVINGQRATFGALQARFEATINNLQITSENLSASRSRIRDADFAAETTNLTRTQILQQAGTAMLAQANALPQQVLKLLG
jgi:flagellin